MFSPQHPHIHPTPCPRKTPSLLYNFSCKLPRTFKGDFWHKTNTLRFCTRNDLVIHVMPHTMPHTSPAKVPIGSTHLSLSRSPYHNFHDPVSSLSVYCLLTRFHRYRYTTSWPCSGFGTSFGDDRSESLINLNYRLRPSEPTIIGFDPKLIPILLRYKRITLPNNYPWTIIENFKSASILPFNLA